MRISTSEFLLGSLPDLLTQQSSVNQLNREIATGQTLLDPSGDPAAAGQVVETADQIQHLSYDAANAAGGAQTIQASLGVLQQVTNVIDQLRQYAVAGANAATTAAERQALVPTAQAALQQLLQLANSQGANGSYLFAGSKAATAPFVTQTGGQVTFNGDAATNSVEIAPGLSVPVTASGQNVFAAIPAGGNGVAVAAAAANTGSAFAQIHGVTSLSQLTAEQLAGTEYQIAFTTAAASGSLNYTVTSGTGSPGSAGFAASSGVVASGGFATGTDLRFGGLDVAIQGPPAAGDSFTVAPGTNSSLFQTVQQLISALGTPQQAQTPNSAALQQIQNSIGNLDAAQTAILTAEASLGAGLSEIRSVQWQDQTQSTNAQSRLSNLQSANLPQVMANYSASITALQAAEEAFARVQGLSLFSFIHP